MQRQTFSGVIELGQSTNYYWTDKLESCAGFALDLIVGHAELHEHNNGFGWGYDGDCADLLSVALLASSLYPGWQVEWENEDGLFEAWRHPDRDRILKHYRAFTEEIVAHLPDEWTMTSDEVLAWLKKKEGNEV